ncbi:hypothetical protein [Pseudomonas azotoformans]|uniref:hypothetical protein n=1 Tax=Pseudomonas azotoformans TaxID=47878 RepID=UPI001CB78D32|nr:hypothetical protein [Pseudomonas azotoformans]UMY49631.1 hypothetical protein MLC69_00820 [Pseudomonas azotoformans]
MHSIPLELAKQKLIFYVAQDLDKSIRSNVQQLVNEVAASRIWSVTPPRFIDEIDESGAEVLGGILEIYSALPPNILPIEKDSKNLDDVEALVGAVKKLSEGNRGQTTISAPMYIGGLTPISPMARKSELRWWTNG